jgi:hypothetical protein
MAEADIIKECTAPDHSWIKSSLPLLELVSKENEQIVAQAMALA